MADLVNPLLPSFTRVESVWQIDDPAERLADVPIGMNNSRRHDDRAGTVLTDIQNKLSTKSLGVLPRVPAVQPEGRWSDKTEAISLIFVFVRTASQPRLCSGDVAHHWEKIFGYFVTPEELSEPPPLIVEKLQFFDHNSVNCTRFEVQGILQTKLEIGTKR